MRAFSRTYLIALVALVAGIALLGLAANLFRAPSGPRPTLAAQVPYELRFGSVTGPETTLHVDAEGRACEVLRASPLLLSACSLATFADTSVIASDAHGALNETDTGAYYGIILRARLDGDASACDRSGLLGTRLSNCRDAVSAPDYRATDAGTSVTVDRAAP